MDVISRRIGGKLKKYPVYTADESEFDSVYWKQAQEGEWASTDVSQTNMWCSMGY